MHYNNCLLFYYHHAQTHYTLCCHGYIFAYVAYSFTYVIVVTQARVPHGTYWLSIVTKARGPQASRANGTTEPIYPIVRTSARVLCHN